MLVKILTPHGWAYAEQLELFSGGIALDEIVKCCGTCRNWKTSSKDSWVKGTCRLSGKIYSYGNMKNCLGWKTATKKQMERRS